MHAAAHRASQAEACIPPAGAQCLPAGMGSPAYPAIPSRCQNAAAGGEVPSSRSVPWATFNAATKPERMPQHTMHPKQRHAFRLQERGPSARSLALFPYIAQHRQSCYSSLMHSLSHLQQTTRTIPCGKKTPAHSSPAMHPPSHRHQTALRQSCAPAPNCPPCR